MPSKVSDGDVVNPTLRYSSLSSSASSSGSITLEDSSVVVKAGGVRTLSFLSIK